MLFHRDYHIFKMYAINSHDVIKATVTVDSQKWSSKHSYPTINLEFDLMPAVYCYDLCH